MNKIKMNYIHAKKEKKQQYQIKKSLLTNLLIHFTNILHWISIH